MSESFNHQARKRFGQNFLHDTNVIEKIVRAITPSADNLIVEIGPGKGAMTAPLLATHKKLTAIEVDRDLAKHLQEKFADETGFTLINQDVLTVDFDSLTKDTNNTESTQNDNQNTDTRQKLCILGNLPYNISTPLIFHLLSFFDNIADMTFMLQLEVANRLCALPGDDDYGRLSIMAQYYCDVEKLFIVPPTAFNPQPKVYSAIVRLKPHSELPYKAKDHKVFSSVVRTAFNQRRKTIRNSLKNVCSSDQLSALGIDPQLRPENLSLQDYVNISNTIGAE